MALLQVFNPVIKSSAMRSMARFAMLQIGLFLGTLAPPATAAPQRDLCVCEAGTFPANEIKYFRMGCKQWLKNQSNCLNQRIVEHGQDYVSTLTTLNITHLRIGYVGHWSSARQTLLDLETRLIPAIQVAQSSLTIDNTACKSLDDPELVHNYIRSLRLSESRLIQIRGNQTDSLGKWDEIFGSRVNFTAEVSTTQPQVQFPSCKRYQNYPCFQQYQLGQSGRCLDRQNQIESLICCKQQVPGGEGGTQDRYVWSQKRDCAT